MPSSSLTVPIDRDAQTVFDYVANVENNPTWRSNVVETEWIDEEPTQPGRRGRQVSRVLGRSYEVIAEVVDWDPPRHVSWKTMAGGADVHTHCRVEPTGDTCELTIETAGEFTGRFLRLLSPLAIAMIKRSVPADIERLKAALEVGRL